MYKIKTSAIPFLEDNGFKRMGENFYSLRFPIYFYKYTPLIFCIATINLSNGKAISIDVEKNGSPYGAWYMDPTPLSKELYNKLCNAIDKKMHKIGARHYEDR